MVQKAIKIVFQSESRKTMTLRLDSNTLDTATQTELRGEILRQCADDNHFIGMLSYLAPFETTKIPPTTSSF